ncbi:pre-peptidase C-terminal domain-containing protein, partial [Microcoleus sp. MON1_C5]|uniref:pre-peptidase C-terminal domain-containing protein n=1 Tax=Microcoleus sp. MON1_C5 TaxID=2818828 RepID=UPI002FCF5B0D
FTLANSSNFSLTLNGLSADADVHLLDSTGTTVLQSSTNGGTAADSISRTLSAGAYYVRVYPYSGSTTYNLSMSAVPNLSAVTVSAPDASAAEVNSGLPANPGMYRISRTGGSTTAPLTVPYTLSGTATNGTDYTSLNGTATIATGQTFVEVPLNVINDTLIENPETAILTLSSSPNYTLGATKAATVNIADNDVVPSDLAPNTLPTARAVTVGSTSTTWSDWVGPQDTNDYYKFTLANSSNFSLTLNGLSADADVHLLDSTGTTVLQSSTNGGTAADSISRTLSAGAYYVRVYPYSGSTTYNLSMSAVPNLSAVTVSAPDASAAEVNSGLPANPGMYRISRTGGSTTAPLTVPYTLSGTAINGTDYTSLNGTATIATGQTFVEVPLNVINDTLIENPETAILTLSSSPNYTLGATKAATVNIADNDVPPDLAPNTLPTARAVTVGSTSTTWSDWVGPQDTNDYYKFTLANRSNFNLTLNGLSQDADVHLLDSTGTTVLQSSTNTGTTADSISRTLSAGAYYVRVYPYNTASTNYNLSMSAVPNLSGGLLSGIVAQIAAQQK